ncbi:fumarylacetoacetase [Ilumatobacter nonamiensis]|uniref:fumarylacetoacetase n=1 Tax=Ilumatobacter nonamiensis TaxID=467093 RepID=UPI00034B29D0|nr:fumarylacetoacetase [Ilumatobacter nonamiensis]
MIPAGSEADASRACCVDVPSGSPFPLHNLPFGVGRRRDESVGAFVAIGDQALDIAAASRFFVGTVAADGLLDDAQTLNQFAALGRGAHREVRSRVTELLTDDSIADDLQPCLVPVTDLTMLLPVAVGDYVDFYSSLHHATNLGRLFRPDGDPLLPNWRHLPVGYHGRSGTIVADHTTISRPHGLRTCSSATGTDEHLPVDGPSEQLDIELEVGFVVGAPSEATRRVATAVAEEHLFGVCLVNDWSARDIQSYEYQPLGPFLGKSFATSMSPWVVTLDALEPFRVDPPTQDPAVSDHLCTSGPTGFDLHLEVLLQSAAMCDGGIDPVVISAAGFADMYWTPAQQIAHMTSNGAHLRAGDLFASGTVSGPDRGSEGSLIELTARGERPLELPDGTTRSFLEDGDCVTLRGWAGADTATRIGLGSVTGTIAGRPVSHANEEDH